MVQCHIYHRGGAAIDMPLLHGVASATLRHAITLHATARHDIYRHTNVVTAA